MDRNIVRYPLVTVNSFKKKSMSDQLLSIRLKEAREKLGITKAEAARRLNLSKIGYCRYEYGERTPSIQTVELIAQCFNTSVDYLLGNTANMSPDHLIVNKSSKPYLFELVLELSDADSSTHKRVLEYYRKLKKTEQKR